MKTLANQTVLIVNDDGISAPGIQLLERIIREHAADVWVVAPDEEKSGASNSLSMHVPVRVRRHDDRHFAIKGTPTDCALMAVYEIMDRAPTLLLSGINRGANLAEDLLYSGTAAAAMEGALLGVPSIAFSQIFQPKGKVHWDTAEKYVPIVLDRLLEQEWEPNTFVNVNFPDAAPEEVSGIRVTTQGRRPPGSFKPAARIDERDVPYYWIKLVQNNGGILPDTDLSAVKDKCVSVCPIQLDMTARRFHDRLNSAFAD